MSLNALANEIKGLTMPKPMQPQSAARKNAEHYFKRAEPQPDVIGRQMRKWERTAGAMNTAGLREPRLPMQAVETGAADNLPAENDAAELALRRKRASPVRSILRMRS
jgi:hypothetical protein